MGVILNCYIFLLLFFNKNNITNFILDIVIYIRLPITEYHLTLENNVLIYFIQCSFVQYCIVYHKNVDIMLINAKKSNKSNCFHWTFIYLFNKCLQHHLHLPHKKIYFQLHYNHFCLKCVTAQN